MVRPSKTFWRDCSAMSHAQDVATRHLPGRFPKHRFWLLFAWTRRGLKAIAFLILANATLALSALATCTAPQNPIEAENCLPGTPASQWYVDGPGSPNIQGFATDISVNAGQTISFKVSTNAIS